MKLSILITHIPERRQLLERLLNMLFSQMGDVKTKQIDDNITKWFDKETELIVYQDNRQVNIGVKRNKLMEIAKGKYICSVDDDDIISQDYISSILSQIESTPDCITFRAERYIKTHDIIFKRNIHRDQNLGKMAYRLPNHLCIWKKELIENVKFPDSSFGEDSAWAKLAGKKIKAFVNIPKVLYYYLNSGEGASSAKKAHARFRHRNNK